MRSWRRSRCAYPAFGGVLLSCLVALSGVHASGAAVDDDLDFLTSVLLTSEAAETRTNAALRLLRLGAPKADLVLAEALRSGDAELVRVVALALTGNGRPPQVVAEALVDALEDGSEGIGPLVGRTLATIGEAQIPQILQVAQSDESTSAARIAAVEALGAFRSKAALEPLIAILYGTEEPTLVLATTNSLNAITQFNFGSDRQTWLNWWDAVGMMPFEQAINPIAADREQLLGEQRAVIEQLASERDTLADRLQMVLGRWYITITDDKERSAQLRSMLADDIAAVRLFAGNQVDLMLRNGESPDQETIGAVRALLDDDDGNLRILGARLLTRLQVEEVSTLLVGELVEESDPAVASVILDLIATRPGIEAFAPVVSRLDDPVAAPASARALVQLVYAGMVPEGWEQEVRQTVRSMHEKSLTPAGVSLFILVGDEADRTSAEETLDHESVDLRRAAARAFLECRLHAPLIARRNDPTIRPIAIEALGLQTSTFENIRVLLDIVPTDQERLVWKASLTRLVVGFPIESRVEIDDMLAPREEISLALRSELLEAALGEQPSADDGWHHRTMVLDRYTQVLTEDRRWTDVAKALGQPGLALEPYLIDRLFHARMQLQDYAGASQIRGTPEPWVAFLETQLIADNAIDVPKVLAQIRERFSELIDAELTARIESLDSMVSASTEDEGA